MERLEISFTDIDTGELIELVYDNGNDSLSLVTGSKIHKAYYAADAVDLSYDREHWALAIDDASFLNGYLAAKWGMEAAKSAI